MLKNQYRYVKYADDGLDIFQCLECYEYFEMPQYRNNINYCCNCGTKFNACLRTRDHYIKKYEYEHPHLTFTFKETNNKFWTVDSRHFEKAHEALAAYRNRIKENPQWNCVLRYGDTIVKSYDSIGYYRRRLG